MVEVHVFLSARVAGQGRVRQSMLALEGRFPLESIVPIPAPGILHKAILPFVSLVRLDRALVQR